MEKSRKQRLKEKRTLMHVINTCIKHKISYDQFKGGCFTVSDFVSGIFVFREQAMSYSSQSIFELRDKLEVYIKHHKQK